VFRENMGNPQTTVADKRTNKTHAEKGGSALEVAKYSPSLTAQKARKKASTLTASIISP